MVLISPYVALQGEDLNYERNGKVMRVNQFISAASGISRRAADAAIVAGRVQINGTVATLGLVIAPHQIVLLDGAPLALPTRHTYIVFNKPAGYVTSRARQGKAATIYDLLPAKFHRLRPVGRLDRDSSGLLMLTDDGDFIQRHTHPSFQKRKVYELTLARPLENGDVTKLQEGVLLSDGVSRVTVAQHAGSEVTIELGEGRNRQLRRTFGALGYGVVRLHRLQMGETKLGALEPGAWAELTETEMA